MEVRLKEAQSALTTSLSELCEFMKHDDAVTVVSHAKQYIRNVRSLREGGVNNSLSAAHVFMIALLDGIVPYLKEQELQKRLDAIERLKKHVEEAEKRFDYVRNVQYFLEAVERDYS